MSGSVQTFPLELDVIPSELKVRVYLHDIDPHRRAISCWSYVTDGLARHGQRELIFTLQRDKGEEPGNYSAAPMALFAAILGFAKEGQIVDAGRATKFGKQKFLGFDGVTYIEPVWVPDDGESRNTRLAMIALTRDEVEAVLAFPPMRVTNILARAEGYYPVPYWTQRGRPARLSFRDMQKSIFSNISSANLGGLCVWRQDGRLVLHLTHGIGEQMAVLLRDLTANSAIAFAAELAPGADAALVWTPGQEGPQAISPEGSAGLRVCGAFVVFISGQKTDEMMLIEDGYSLLLTNETWLLLREALMEERNLDLPLVSMIWAAKGWQVHVPQSSPAEQVEAVRTRQVVLGQKDSELARSITVEALAAHVQAIETLVRGHFGLRRVEEATELQVVCHIEVGGKAEYTLASRPQGLSAKTLQPVWDDLQSLAVPEVRNRVSFAIEFEIRGNG